MRIVRRLDAKGDTSLTPEALRMLLEIAGPEEAFHQRPLDVHKLGQAGQDSALHVRNVFKRIWTNLPRRVSDSMRAYVVVTAEDIFPFI